MDHSGKAGTVLPTGPREDPCPAPRGAVIAVEAALFAAQMETAEQEPAFGSF